MNLQNTLYQAYWHGFKKQKYRNAIDKFSRNVDSYATAKMFGTPKKLFMGDSNCEGIDNFADSRRFNDLTVVFGFGGTTPDDYVNFFRSKFGESFYAMVAIDKPKIFFNIGGNSVLQKKMDTCRHNLVFLKQYFPDSLIFNIPPIHAGILEVAGVDKSEILYKNIGTVNRYLTEIWGTQVVDIASAILNPVTGEAVYGSLEDPVHYSRAIRQHMVKVINGA